MRLTGDPAPGTMNSSSGSGNFLLVPIPEYPLLDCLPNKTVKIVVLGASNVGKTGMDGWMEELRQGKSVHGQTEFHICLKGLKKGERQGG